MTKRWGRPHGMTLLNFTGWQLLFVGLMLQLNLPLWSVRVVWKPWHATGYKEKEPLPIYGDSSSKRLD